MTIHLKSGLLNFKKNVSLKERERERERLSIQAVFSVALCSSSSSCC